MNERESKELDKELDKVLDEMYNDQLLDNIFNEVMHYESLYHCLCSSFSKAYLEGSDWYIGESLVDWWLCVESDVNSYNKKFDKFDYIKEIIDMFMNKDTNNK